MRNRNKVDPSIAKVMRASANAQSHAPIMVYASVGKRKITSFEFVPQNTSEFLRYKANRGLAEGLNAFEVKAVNSEGYCSADIYRDGKIVAKGYEKFGRVINTVNLIIQNHFIERAYTPEGIKALVG